jgi:hypothetical protein
MSTTASQEQNQTNLLYECQDVFPKVEYDKGTLTALKHKMDIFLGKPHRTIYLLDSINLPVQRRWKDIQKFLEYRGYGDPPSYRWGVFRSS